MHRRLSNTPTTGGSGRTCGYRFPHPYTRRDGQAFVRYARASQPETSFALEVDGAAVGGIGFALQPDVERVSSEIGYWVGEAHWGAGFAPRRCAR